ncbi:hypothetical protein HAZT_HAZT004997 [Hyalella azteca]|uniref:Integrase catalytic domain-containing protein n=1 Tax=Hyalella azteca TaxID=294128 RepID=A0A6A0GVB8_HYAAZ|nr:hypothetical protein HAZT_HAZT004997 [Hyalella azteca]
MFSQFLPILSKQVALGESSGSELPRYLRVVPREDIFDTLLKIHLKHNHSTLRETAHLVRSVISNIPRYLVHKFILLCPVCSNNGASGNSSGLPYTPSRRCMIKARRRRKLMDQFQVDVLDLKDNPDGSYRYILHCMDHITGFHWLFPLAAIDPAEVAQNLVWGIFSLFGFPSELVSDYGKEFASAVIEEVTRLWPDELQIKNYLEGSSYKGDVSRRNTRNVTRFIEHMAAQKAAAGDSRLKWSEWLPEIQFLLNSTILDVRTGKTPYEKVFRMQPITPPLKPKLGPAPGEVPSRKYTPKRRRHHLKYTPEFLTEDVIDHAKVLTVDDDDIPDVATHAVVAAGPTVILDGAGELHEMHDLTSNVSGIMDITSGMEDVAAPVAAMQEVVATTTSSDANSGNVVVVDIAGVEHTVENSVVTDGYVTTDDRVTAADHVMTQFMSPGDAYNFGAAGASYSLLPSAGDHEGVDGSYEVTTDDATVEMTFVDDSSYEPRLEDAQDDEVTYMDETSAAERCVTLSADGRQLEVAQIKPAPLPVKIGARTNQRYRIEPFSRTVEYVDDGSIKSRAVELLDQRLQKHTHTSVLSPTKSKRVIQLSDKRKSGTAMPKTIIKNIEVTSYGPGTNEPRELSAVQRAQFVRSKVPSLKMPSEYSPKPIITSNKFLALTTGQSTKSTVSVTSTSELVSEEQPQNVSEVLPASKCLPGEGSSPAMFANKSTSKAASKSKVSDRGFTGFLSSKLDDIPRKDGMFQVDFDSSDEDEFDGVLSGDEGEEIFM